jgi:ATP-binding cassette, subfamily B (MDR/TAP), member 1
MYEQASTIASDAIGNIRTVASFCAEDKIVENYRKKCEGPVKEGVRQGAISGLGYGFSFALLFCFYAVSFYIGARFIHDGTADVGQVFKVKMKEAAEPSFSFSCLFVTSDLSYDVP